MRGSLHFATDDETVCCSGRDDATFLGVEEGKNKSEGQRQKQIPPTALRNDNQKSSATTRATAATRAKARARTTTRAKSNDKRRM